MNSYFDEDMEEEDEVVPKKVGGDEGEKDDDDDGVQEDNEDEDEVQDDDEIPEDDSSLGDEMDADLPMEGEFEEEEEEDEFGVGNNGKNAVVIKGYRGGDEDDDDDEEDDEDGSKYLQKFDMAVRKNYIAEMHPECIVQNYDEVGAMTHFGHLGVSAYKTIPFLTKYERTRILGQRAKQINAGCPAFVSVPENIIDGYIVAEMELKAGRIPFIIRRPLPNGASEFWKVSDLKDINW